jgi:hypothetical protein
VRSGISDPDTRAAGDAIKETSKGGSGASYFCIVNSGYDVEETRHPETSVVAAGTSRFRDFL